MTIIKHIHYLFFEIFILILKNINHLNKYLIITPRLFSYLLKNVYIFDLRKKRIFSQKIRNFYDINTVFQIFGYQEYDINFLKIPNSKILKNKKSLIVDCGANIGSTSKYFSDTYNNSYIISIEPDKNNFSLLCKNINKKNTLAINSAVASRNYFYKIDKSIDPRSHKINIVEKNKNSKKTITINQILKKNHLCKPFIIKIDIEGFEKDLFKQNIDWMDKFKIIIIEIHDWMLPNKNISKNFIIALNKVMKKNNRDLVIKGENLISIKYK